jgi:cytochrome c
MKIALSLFFGAMISVSCNNSPVKEKETDSIVDGSQQEETEAIDSMYRDQPGYALMIQSDCFRCHDMNQRIAGPSLKEIAERYKETVNRDTLANRIINGSVGVWGELPMTPHKDLPDSTVKQMLNFILAQNAD